MTLRSTLGASLFILAGAGEAFAHASPPVILVTERDAVAALSGGAATMEMRSMTLTSVQRAAVRKEFGWKAGRAGQRVYMSGDAGRTGVPAVVFMTEATHHGPLRVAVAVDAEGRVKDARVVEVTDESLRWVKPLIDDGLPREFVGRGCHDAFTLPARFAGLTSMRRFYAERVGGLIHHATIFYEVAVRPRATATD